MHTQAHEDGRVVYVDRALWRRLSHARTTEEFARAWLALQCSMVGAVRSAVVVYGEPDCGPFRPIASFPDEGAPGGNLAELTQEALESGEPRIAPLRGGVDGLIVAYPLSVDARTYGVVGVELRAGEADAVLRQLQWGASWLDAWVRREHAHEEQQTSERLMQVLELIATALAHERFQAAAAALATELATQLKCDRVSVGVERRGRCEVVALSHTALGDGRMNLQRAIGAAMDEALDQRAVLSYPPRDNELLVHREHKQLAETHGNGVLLTIPLLAVERAYGALLLERPAAAPFTEQDVELCKSVALALGPMLEVKRRHDRNAARKLADAIAAQGAALLGPRHWGRKLGALAAAALAAFLVFATGQYRVTADATVEGAVRRSVTAPIDGYLATVDVRPGDAVTAGQLLSSFDDRDLRLERLQVASERAQLLARQQDATARGERAQALVIGTQVQQNDAHLALLDEQLARTQIRAPFAGLVVSGDLSQSLGAPLALGAPMFEIAPLDAYRVVLAVDEHDVATVAPGQRGSLVLAALPSSPLAFEIERVTPVATAAEGSNVFRVEASLEAGDPRVRPGMQGVAKVEIDRRPLGWIWTHRVVRAARLKLWAWLP